MGNKNYSKGITWIDDCRIPTTDKQQVLINTGNKNLFHKDIRTKGDKKIELVEPIGRFPANILVSDDMLNDGKITKVQDNLNVGKKQYGGGTFAGGLVNNNFYFGDKGSNSRYYDIDKWFNNLIDG